MPVERHRHPDLEQKIGKNRHTLDSSDATSLASPLSTKGDIWIYAGANTRMPVGTDGQVLAADSGNNTGLSWADISTGNILDDIDQDLLPTQDRVFDLGSADFTWAQLYVDFVHENTGSAVIDTTARQLMNGAWNVDGDFDPNGGNLYDLGDGTNVWKQLTVNTIRNAAGTGIWTLAGDLAVADDIAADNILPNADVTYNLGSAAFTWAQLFTDDIYDRAGTQIFDVQNATFKVDHIIDTDSFDQFTFKGTTSGGQWSMGIPKTGWGGPGADSFAIGDVGTAYRFVIDPAGDVGMGTLDPGHPLHLVADNADMFAVEGVTSGKKWSLGVPPTGALSPGTSFAIGESGVGYHFVIQAGGNVVPGVDVARDLGTTTLTWSDLYVDDLHDRAGTQIYDVQNATFKTGQRFDTFVGIGKDADTHLLDILGASARLRNTSGDPTFIIETDSTGDVKLQFLLTGTRAWEIGIDNTDSDKLMFSPASGLAGAVVTMEVDGDVGIGTTAPAAELHIDQSSTTGAQEVLTLDQADIDQNFVKYIGTSSTGTADQSLVNAAHFTTAGAIQGWVQVSIQDDSGSTGALADSHYWMPIYATPTA